MLPQMLSYGAGQASRPEMWDSAGDTTKNSSMAKLLELLKGQHEPQMETGLDLKQLLLQSGLTLGLNALDPQKQAGKVYAEAFAQAHLQKNQAKWQKQREKLERDIKIGEIEARMEGEKAEQMYRQGQLMREQRRDVKGDRRYEEGLQLDRERELQRQSEVKANQERQFLAEAEDALRNYLTRADAFAKNSYEVSDEDAAAFEAERQGIIKRYGQVLDPSRVRPLPSSKSMAKAKADQLAKQWDTNFKHRQGVDNKKLAQQKTRLDNEAKRIQIAAYNSETARMAMQTGQWGTWWNTQIKVHNAEAKAYNDSLDNLAKGGKTRAGVAQELAGVKAALKAAKDDKTKEYYQGEAARLQGELDFLDSQKQQLLPEAPAGAMPPQAGGFGPVVPQMGPEGWGGPPPPGFDGRGSPPPLGSPVPNPLKGPGQQPPVRPKPKVPVKSGGIPGLNVASGAQKAADRVQGRALIAKHPEKAAAIKARFRQQYKEEL